MKKIIKNYKQSIILIGSLIIGTIVGLIFKEKATVLEPLGTLFINMLLVVVVPLIFLSITTSIGKIDKPKRVGKILRSIIIAFVFTSLVSVVIGLTSLKIRLVDSGDANKITALLDESTEVSDDASVLDKLVNSVSTNDFVNLLSKNNILALIVISILSGLAINKSGEKGKSFLKVLDSAYEVLQSLIKILMYYAPIGLGCYFASFTGTFGASVTQGFVKMLVIYTILVLFVYFVIYSLYAYMAAGKIGVKKYWANIIPASTGAAVAVGKVLPNLLGKLDGMAFRVPVTDGSVVDLTVELKRNVTVEEVNAALKNASNETLGFTMDPIVSSDIIGSHYGSLVDGLCTTLIEVDGKQMVKVVAWYDNEMSYSTQMVRTAKLLGTML